MCLSKERNLIYGWHRTYLSLSFGMFGVDWLSLTSFLPWIIDNLIYCMETSLLIMTICCPFGLFLSFMSLCYCRFGYTKNILWFIILKLKFVLITMEILFCCSIFNVVIRHIKIKYFQFIIWLKFIIFFSSWNVCKSNVTSTYKDIIVILVYLKQVFVNNNVCESLLT